MKPPTLTNKQFAVAAGARVRHLLSVNSLREFVFALGTQSVTRQHLSEWVSGLKREQHLFPNQSVFDVLDELGLRYAVGKRDFRSVSHPSAKSWSSCLVWTSSDVPSWEGKKFLYIGSEDREVRRARDADEAEDHATFGLLLGYPECCCEFFEQEWPQVAGKTCDLLSRSYWRTAEGGPFSRFANLATQYFGCSTISFFPCSFECPEAIARGELALSLISAINDNELTNRLHWYSACSVLYLGQRGVALLPGASIRDGVVWFSPTTVKVTSPQSQLVDLLAGAKTLRALSPERLEIQMLGGAYTYLEDCDVALCVFR